MFFELDKAGDLLRFYRDFIVDAPEQLGCFPAYQIAPPLPFIPEDRHGEPFIAMVACWAGDLAAGEKALEPIRDVAPRVAEMVGPMPYPALNSAFDALVPPGLHHYWKANFVKELTDDAIAAHLEHGPKLPAVNSTMHIYPINGACHRVAQDATAFAYRDANFATVIAGMWPPDQVDDEAGTAWVRDYYDATAPHSEEGGYVNFMASDDQDRVRANYRGSYDRLREIKVKLDPGNVAVGPHRSQSAGQDSRRSPSATAIVVLGSRSRRLRPTTVASHAGRFESDGAPFEPRARRPGPRRAARHGPVMRSADAGVAVASIE